LVEQICHGATSSKDIKDREVKPVVRSWLSRAQEQLLDQHAPERLSWPMPNTQSHLRGRRQSLCGLRIQELYDVTRTPRLR